MYVKWTTFSTVWSILQQKAFMWAIVIMLGSLQVTVFCNAHTERNDSVNSTQDIVSPFLRSPETTVKVQYNIFILSGNI